MKQHLSFACEDSADRVRQRVIRYFEGAGYHIVRQDDVVVFRRGSFLAGMFSFSPKRWRSVVTVHVAPALDGEASATIDYDINTTGQTITPGEVVFWNAEMAGLQQAVLEGRFDSGQNAAAEQTAVSGNWAFLRQMLLGALIVIPLMLLLMPGFALMGKVARWIMRLVPVVGKDAAGVILVLVVLALGVVLFLFQESAIAWSGWIVRRLPPSASKRGATAISLAIYVAVLAVFFTLFYTIMAVLRNLHSPNEMIWWGLLIVGVLVLAVIADRREKKKS